MTAEHARDRSLALDESIQAYVDGTLDEKSALRLHLRAQADPEVEVRLREAREFFAELDAMPRQEPSIGFDAAILASVPLERYRTAPRKRPAVLVLDDFAPSRLVRTLQSMGRMAVATTTAYVLTLVLAGTQVGRLVADGAAWVESALASTAANTESVPLVGSVVAGLGSVYRTAQDGVARVSEAIGVHGATMVLGVLLGVVVVALIAAHRRREALGAGR